MKNQIKILLTQIGAYAPTPLITGFAPADNYLAAGRWFKQQGFKIERRFKDRYELFDLAGREIASERVLYLEFGVWKGEATRHWAKLLKHPQALLHGFDSFEGLPEDWNELQKGNFSTGGEVPQIDDPRVQFFKGWFEQTLSGYKLPPHDRLFLNLDADLYSSTRLVLDHLGEHLKVGSYLYFDEFNDRHHEMKAFDEFLRRTGMQFRLVGVNEHLSNVIFQRIK